MWLHVYQGKIWYIEQCILMTITNIFIFLKKKLIYLHDS